MRGVSLREYLWVVGLVGFFGISRCAQDCVREARIIYDSGTWIVCGTDASVPVVGDIDTLQIEKAGPQDYLPSIVRIGAMNSCFAEPETGTVNAWKVALPAFDLTGESPSSPVKAEFCFMSSNNCLEIEFNSGGKPGEWRLALLDKSSIASVETHRNVTIPLTCPLQLSRHLATASFLKVTDVKYDAPSADCPSERGCWQIHVFYNAGHEGLKTALYLSRAVSERNALPSMTEFPWERGQVMPEPTACTLKAVPAHYIVTSDVSQWVEANDKHFDPGETADVGDFRCMGVKDFLSFPKIRAGNFTDLSADHTLRSMISSVDQDTPDSDGSKNAVIVIAEEDVAHIGFTDPDRAPGSTDQLLFVGLLEFQATGSPYIDAAAQQVLVRLRKSGPVIFAASSKIVQEVDDVQLADVELHTVLDPAAEDDPVHFATLEFEVGSSRRRHHRRRGAQGRLETESAVVSVAGEQQRACALVEVSPLLQASCGPWPQTEETPICTSDEEEEGRVVRVSLPLPSGPTEDDPRVSFLLELAGQSAPGGRVEPVGLAVQVTAGAGSEGTVREWCAEEHAAALARKNQPAPPLPAAPKSGTPWWIWAAGAGGVTVMAGAGAACWRCRGRKGGAQTKEEAEEEAGGEDSCESSEEEGPRSRETSNESSSIGGSAYWHKIAALAGVTDLPQHASPSPTPPHSSGGLDFAPALAGAAAPPGPSGKRALPKLPPRGVAGAKGEAAGAKACVRPREGGKDEQRSADDAPQPAEGCQGGTQDNLSGAPGQADPDILRPPLRPRPDSGPAGDSATPGEGREVPREGAPRSQRAGTRKEGKGRGAAAGGADSIQALREEASLQGIETQVALSEESKDGGSQPEGKPAAEQDDVVEQVHKWLLPGWKT